MIVSRRSRAPSGRWPRVRPGRSSQRSRSLDRRRAPGSISNTARVTTATTDNVPAQQHRHSRDPDQPAPCGLRRDGDGLDEIVTGAGPGGGPHVNVLTLATGAVTNSPSFFAYDPDFGGGVRGRGDVDGDGLADIVTGAGAGGGPHVEVFDGLPATAAASTASSPTTRRSPAASASRPATSTATASPTSSPAPGPAAARTSRCSTAPTARCVGSFFAYDAAVHRRRARGGGRRERRRPRRHHHRGVSTGGPVRVFTFGPGGGVRASASSPTTSGFRGAVRVAAGDVNGDGLADIITGAGPGGGPHVQAFGVAGAGLTNSPASTPTTRPSAISALSTPIRRATAGRGGGDVDGDGVAEIITGTNRQGGPLRIFRIGAAVTELTSFYPYFEAFVGPVYVAAVALAALPRPRSFSPRASRGGSIRRPLSFRGGCWLLQPRVFIGSSTALSIRARNCAIPRAKRSLASFVMLSSNTAGSLHIRMFDFRQFPNRSTPNTDFSQDRIDGRGGCGLTSIARTKTCVTICPHSACRIRARLESSGQEIWKCGTARDTDVLVAGDMAACCMGDECVVFEARGGLRLSMSPFSAPALHA